MPMREKFKVQASMSFSKFGCLGYRAMLRYYGCDSQAETFHNKNVHNKIPEFLGRGCFYCKMHRGSEKKRRANIKRKIRLKIGILFSVVVCFGPETTYSLFVRLAR